MYILLHLSSGEVLDINGLRILCANVFGFKKASQFYKVKVYHTQINRTTHIKMHELLQVIRN